MKKRIFLLVILLLIIFTSAVNAGNFEVKDLDLNITVSDSYDVLTKDNLENNNFLTNNDLTAEYVLDYMMKNDIFFNAISGDELTEIIIEMKTDSNIKKVFDLNGFNDSNMKEIAEAIISNQEMIDLGITYKDYSFYKGKQANFIILNSEMEAYNSDRQQYYTIINGQAITITFASYNDTLTTSEKEELLTIIESVHFNNVKTNPIKVLTGVIIFAAIVFVFLIFAGIIIVVIIILKKKNKKNKAVIERFDTIQSPYLQKEKENIENKI